MKKTEKLDVLENWYQVVDWYIRPHDGGKVYSDIKKFEGLNELEDYRNSGVYHMADIPYSVKEINPESYEEDPYLAFAKAYSDAVYSSVKEGNIFLAVGSYCTHVPSILGGIQRAVGREKKIGVIWLDAHADNYICETTKETCLRLIGVPMSVFLGKTMPEWQEAAGLILPIEGEYVLAADIRYRDEETDCNLNDSKVHLVTQTEFQNAVAWREKVNELSERTDAIFLHVDADILHHSYLPAYEYDVKNGNNLDIVLNNIKAVMDTGKVLGASVMCVGFENKEDRLRDVNNMNGIRLVSGVLRNWKEQPD